MVDPTNRSGGSRQVNDEPPRQENQPQKTGPSAFDEVLRQTRNPQSSQQQQGAQQGASILQKQVESREGCGQQQRDDQQEERKDSRKESRSTDRDSRSGDSRDTGRVEAKGQRREQEGSGGRGQGQSSGGRGQMTKEAAQTKLKMEKKGAAQTQAQSTFASELKKVQGQEVLSPRHMQQIVNQVMQYFRVRKLTTGETELELGFREEIFKGLRLRLISKDGKVSLHILSGEGDVRRLFEKNRDDITKALTDKGVALHDIVIGTG